MVWFGGVFLQVSVAIPLATGPRCTVAGFGPSESYQSLDDRRWKSDSSGLTVRGPTGSRFCDAIVVVVSYLQVTRGVLGERADLPLAGLYLLLKGRWSLVIEPTDGDTFADGDGGTIYIGNEKRDTLLWLVVLHEVAHALAKAGRLDVALGLPGLVAVQSGVAATDWENTLRMAIAVLTGEPVCLRVDGPDMHRTLPLRGPCALGATYKPPKW
jgi:hypothetical protein